MFAAHSSVAAQLHPQQAAAGILPYGDCLLLLALKDALHRLSSQAFIRQDVAQTIAAVAQQELIALVVRSAPSLPSICLTGRLLLYRHRQQHWLLVLQSVHAATLSPLSLSSHATGSSSTSGDVPPKARQRGEVVMAYLRRFLPKDKREGVRALHSGTVAKYNLPGSIPHSGSSQDRASSRSGGASETNRETTQSATETRTEPSTCGAPSSCAAPTVASGTEAPPSEPALDGVIYFTHEGVLRASLPSSHLPKINAVISAALSATGGGSPQPQEGKKRKA
ncbi:conserved hypothetical protein [Neospora caninum Liverpool]|uniref:Uncharacterized protein n=1 Tax=Neospora caninum (strain Liverpool) TaxID=572307 RepID=F0VNI1_NEOCL|nr:conserved hypothetical protein [Neospora caninum Liverpool]CBZ55277.1 conserved hypothetical protein [Neospora caninum Liverpool]|eukprot:XP_003885305.1 conserved hypothetical protein [Neospora caninum Liverpool]